MGSFQAAALDGDSQRILLPFGLGADHWTGLSPPQTWKHFGGRRDRAGNKLQALVCHILPSFLPSGGTCRKARFGAWAGNSHVSAVSSECFELSFSLSTEVSSATSLTDEVVHPRPFPNPPTPSVCR